MHASNTMQGHAQLVADTARSMLRNGEQPVLVWLPSGLTNADGKSVLRAYLCALVPGRPPTYKVIATLGDQIDDDNAYDKDGIAFAALEAGAQFRQFRQVGATAGAVRVVLPSGSDVHAK